VIARPPARTERGETLVELMVTMVIMATAVVALVGGIAASIRFSDFHRKQATAGVYVRAFAESLASSVSASPTGYTACATPSTYQSVYTVPNPAGYQATITAVTYWDGTSSFVATCPAGGDVGVQRVSLQVASIDGRATETLSIVIRRPCRPAADFPQDAPCT
jgi:Tfp pilus assembly protein PilV